MDKYFYSVELNSENKKVIHLFGNIYNNDADTSETNYRAAEWTYMYLDLKQVSDLLENDSFYEFINEKVQYLGDITEKQAKKMCLRYFNGNPGTKLHIKEVNQDTPCGDYWFE